MMSVWILSREAVFIARSAARRATTPAIGPHGDLELLVVDEELRKALNEGANEQVLLKMASGKGLRSYYCDGAEKILLGITSVEEVMQAS